MRIVNVNTFHSKFGQVYIAPIITMKQLPKIPLKSAVSHKLN